MQIVNGQPVYGATVHRAGHPNTRLSPIDLKYGFSSEICKNMAAQYNVYLEICVLFTAGQMEALLKYSLISAHTDKSNTSFKSIKTLRLFMCTHNNNKTLRFCKIIKANRMRFLPSRSRMNLSSFKIYIYRELNVYI